MADVGQAVTEQRTRNVHPYLSQPVVPLPEPGDQSSEAFDANTHEEEEQDATNRLGNTDGFTIQKQRSWWFKSTL